MLQCSMRRSTIMTDTSKSIPTSNAALSLLAAWARQGAESFAATQKILLDLAAQQNSLDLGFVRERVSDLPFGPVSGLVEFAGQGAANFIDRKSTRLNSSHLGISYAVFCLKK